MKKKMAIVLSAVFACSLSMTVTAAPSPSIEKEPVTQTVVSAPVATSGTAGQTNNVVSEKSAVLPDTKFVTQAGQAVDQSAVKMVIASAAQEQAQAVTNSLVEAIVSPQIQVLNFTGKEKLYLTDKQNRIDAIAAVNIGLQTESGEVVGHNGSVSAAFILSHILGGRVLEDGETIQALYERADGTWIAVPVVIRNGVAAVALPAFSEPVDVVFLVVKGYSLENIPLKAGKSPQT